MGKKMCNVILVHHQLMNCIDGRINIEDFAYKLSQHIEKGVEYVLMDVSGSWIPDDFELKPLDFYYDKKLNMTLTWCSVDFTLTDISGYSENDSFELKTMIEDAMVDWVGKFKLKANRNRKKSKNS